MMFRNITSYPSQHYVLMQKWICVLSSDMCKKGKNTVPRRVDDQPDGSAA